MIKANLIISNKRSRLYRQRAALFFGIMLCAVTVSGQTNYYVSSTGNNSNSGIQTLPWLTIQAGLNKLKAGDTLNIMNGTYNEKLKFPISGITLRNCLNNNPVIDATDITSQVPVIEITDVSNAIVQGLEIRNNIMLDAQGILVTGNCQNITIKNCKIHDIHFSSNVSAAVNENTNAQGIIVYGTNATTAISNLKITNNQLYNCRLGYSEGIAVNGNVSGFEVSGNTVHDLTNIGIDIIGFEGTCSNAANDQARNGVVRNNLIHHCVSTYATSGGLYVDGGKNIILENNTSYHNGYGIEVGCENVGKATDLITVRNNVFYDNEVCALALGGWDYPKSGKVTNSTFRNNTCYFDDYSKSGNGEIYLSYSENSIIENNIFFTTTENTLAYAELSQPSLTFNYNLIYCSAGADNLSVDWNKKSYSGYAAFVTGTGLNVNSKFGNPPFVNATISNPDFHIQSSSPAINAGNPAFLPAPEEVDMDNQNRKSGIIDCGADEYYVINGISENTVSENQLTAFPNPASYNITIKSSGLNLIKMVVYDSMGKQIRNYSVEKLQKQIDVSAFHQGLYYLVGFDTFMKPVATQKLIIK